MCRSDEAKRPGDTSHHSEDIDQLRSLSYRPVAHRPHPAGQAGRLPQDRRHVPGVSQDELWLAVVLRAPPTLNTGNDVGWRGEEISMIPGRGVRGQSWRGSHRYSSSGKIPRCLPVERLK